MTAPITREPRDSAEPAPLTHYTGSLTSGLDDLTRKARQEAAAFRPPTNAVRMDQNEVALQSSAEKLAANEHQLFSHVLAEASREAHELLHKVPQLEARIQRVLANDSLQTECAAELAEERASLVSSTEQRMRHDVDLRAFRAKHGITEQAVYPDSHVWHFAIILVLALGETSINAFFYENAQGLLGGFIVALSVSAVNMFGALALGWGFRLKNLGDADKRAAGWACSLAFVVLTIYCNALFAAFRSNYQILANPTDPMQVRRAFREAAGQAGHVFVFGMQFGDLMSFILFGVGLLLSCLAFYKGYTFDDRYPGHGAKDKKAKTARDAELALRESARQKVKGLLQRRRSELLSLTREPEDLMSAAGQRAAAVQHAHTVYSASQDAIQRDFALLLRSYRDANAAIRATEPPAYFRQMPDIRVPVDPGVPAGVLEVISSGHEQAKAVREKYQQSLNAKLNELQRESAVLLDSSFGEFLRSIDRDAEEAINRMTVAAERASLNVLPQNAQ